MSERIESPFSIKEEHPEKKEGRGRLMNSLWTLLGRRGKGMERVQSRPDVAPRPDGTEEDKSTSKCIAGSVSMREGTCHQDTWEGPLAALLQHSGPGPSLPRVPRSHSDSRTFSLIRFRHVG